MKTGILLHVYHLEVLGWEALVWGDPALDQLGTLTKFVDCLLDIPASDEVFSIIYSGPSQKDGMAEGVYARQFLLDHIDHLGDFPRLRHKLERLSTEEHRIVMERVRGLVAGPVIKNTRAELENGAVYFAERGVQRVLQIAAASHAPRCVKLQAVVRAAGLIPQDQQWFLVPSETCFNGGEPSDVVILEPPHRADDPVLGIHPSLPQTLLRYQYEITGQYRRDAMLKIAQVVADVAAEQARAAASDSSVLQP